MNNREINSFIKTIDSTYSIDDAYFGFFYEDIDEYATFIRGNKEGLRLLASELLKASNDVGKTESFSLAPHWNYENSEIFISRIELSNKSRDELENLNNEEHEENWKNRMTSYVIFGILIFILCSILVGAFTIIDWIF